jgi:hypothetical protein
VVAGVGGRLLIAGALPAARPDTVAKRIALDHVGGSGDN